MSEDNDIWGVYAKGVKKIGHKADEPAPTKTNLPARQEKENKDVPEAWRTAMEKEGTISVQPIEAVQPDEPVVLAPSAPPAARKKEPLDLRIERNLSLGDVVIEARLDLHGQTEEQAHARLLNFIEEQMRLGRRLALVITGKGKEGASVLRANLPRWCEVPPLDEAVLAVRTAAPHHGGEGAYYVLMTRKKA